MRNILITGTSSGIGLAASVELAKRGERVFASMRDLSKSGHLRAALEEAGVQATILQLDVTDDASVRRAVTDVISAAGSIDVLLNNAGIGAVGPLELTSDEEMLRIFDTNVFGVLRTVRAVLPFMRARGEGRIVNVSSGAAHSRVGIRLWGAYAASKAALHTLTMELLKEVSPLGIEVVLLEGGVGGQTPVWDDVRAKAATFEGGAYEFNERIATAQISAASGGTDALPGVTKFVADACTVQNPAIRFPAELQAGADAADRLSDAVFARLARGETDPSIYESVPGFWPLQRVVLLQP